MTVTLDKVSLRVFVESDALQEAQDAAYPLRLLLGQVRWR